MFYGIFWDSVWYQNYYSFFVFSYQLILIETTIKTYLFQNHNHYKVHLIHDRIYDITMLKLTGSIKTN